MVFARVFDVVNDPIEGWIMDRAKPGKYGKCKSFIFLSIALISVGAGALLFIPSGMTGSSFAVCAWVILGTCCMTPAVPSLPPGRYTGA